LAFMQKWEELLAAEAIAAEESGAAGPGPLE
jgi:hypothetical protein